MNESKASGMQSSEETSGTPWDPRSVRFFPKLELSVEELITHGQNFLNPLQKFAVVSVVRDDDDDPTVPAASQTNACAMAILRTFPDMEKAEEFKVSLPKKGFKGSVFIIPMGRFGIFPPPRTVEKTYADPRLNKLMERYKHMRNMASETLETRINDMKVKQAEERKAFLEREKEWREKEATASEEEKKARDLAVKESNARQDEYKHEADRLLQELEKERETLAKENMDIASGDVALITEPAALKAKFKEDCEHQFSKANLAYIKRCKDERRDPQKDRKDSDAVTIRTAAGAFSYMPLYGPVMDDAFAKVRQHLVSHGCPDPMKVHTQSSNEPPPAGARVVADLSPSS